MAITGSSMLIKLLLVLSFAVGALCSGGQVRAFYLVQQWLGSYCNQRGTRCCYPPTGKPRPDFTIYGLWPYYSDGSFPYNCGSQSYDVAPLKPLETRLHQEWPSFTCPQIGRKFWLHEWNKHGTCSKDILGEIQYFNAASNLKNKMNVLQALNRAGIVPNNQAYRLKAVKKAIARGVGFRPWVDCNHDAQGHSQLWQVTLCADRTGTRLINCPYIPRGRNGCSSKIKFPSYY